MNGRGKDIKNGSAKAYPPLLSADKRPPKEQRGEEKAYMLQCMNKIAGKCSLKKFWRMPNP
jgi:hypothetical protein